MENPPPPRTDTAFLIVPHPAPANVEHVVSTLKKPIYCFGEILWDCLPRGLFLGGAPLNVACHVAQLGATSKIISCVGNDFLGREALRRAEALGVDVSSAALHPELPTGTVSVKLDEGGNATYEFPSPVAWDEVPVDDVLKGQVDDAGALVFGTLALRLHTNRERLDELLEATSALKCLDVNLRPPYDDIERALKFASKADVVKLNEEELARLTDTPTAYDADGLAEQCRRLKALTHTTRVCVTRGGEGGFFWNDGQVHTATTPKVQVKDTVGAGDAFMAALVHGLVAGDDIDAALQAACERGAKVASQDGAV